MIYTVLNPHLSDFFAKPLAFILLKRRALKKYEYIINPGLDKTANVNFLFNNLSSSLFPDKIFSLFPFFVKKNWLKAEIKIWKKINKISPNIHCFFDVKEVPERNVLFMLCYRNYKQPDNVFKIAAEYKHVIAHLSHYYAFPVEYSNVLKNIEHIHIAADSDVGDNVFFKQYFSWYNKQILYVPFCINERFTCKKPFEQRENKAIATGTFHLMEYDVSPNEVSFAILKKISNTAHPIRRMLYENKESVAAYVDVYCKPYYEKNINYLNNTKTTTSNKLKASQSQYFSFDIVDKYNQYKFAVIGEETINGLPGIGSFEAMACGCVLIADPACYKGLEMQAGVHYLSYNNSIESLIEVIKNNTDQVKLASISNAASKLIQSTMQPKQLKKHFLDTIKNL